MIRYSNKMPYVYLFLVHFVHSLTQKIQEKDVIFESTHMPVKLLKASLTTIYWYFLVIARNS